MAKETMLGQVANLSYEAQNLLIKEVSETAAHLGISYDDQLTLIAAFHSVQGGGSGTETIPVLRNSLYSYEKADTDLSDLSIVFPAPGGISHAAKEVYDAIIYDYSPYTHDGVMPPEARALMTEGRVSDADGKRMIDTYWSQAFVKTDIVVKDGDPSTSTSTEIHT